MPPLEGSDRVEIEHFPCRVTSRPNAGFVNPDRRTLACQSITGYGAMLRLLLVIVLVLVVLSFFGGYGGYVSPNYGYGGGGVGLIILIVLLVLLFR